MTATMTAKLASVASSAVIAPGRRRISPSGAAARIGPPREDEHERRELEARRHEPRCHELVRGQPLLGEERAEDGRPEDRAEDRAEEDEADPPRAPLRRGHIPGGGAGERS